MLSEIFTWQFWIISGIVLLIVEVFTPGFLLACFGISAIIASVPAMLGLSPIWSILLFSIGSLLTLWFLRPFILRVSKRPEVPTNVDALLGRRVRVVETINNKQDTGRVQVDGDVWVARTMDNDSTIFETGEEVEICQRKSLILYIKKIS